MFKAKAFLIPALLAVLSLCPAAAQTNYYAPFAFGTDTGYARGADETATGRWFEKSEADFPGKAGEKKRHFKMIKWFKERPRDKAIGFCLYTVDHGTLKLTAQCFPLLPKEPKTVTLEVMRGGKWQAIQEQPVQYPGWSAHFRVENWDHSVDTPYRARLGELASFTGLVRKNASDKDSITVASTSCNSPYDEIRLRACRPGQKPALRSILTWSSSPGTSPTTTMSTPTAGCSTGSSLPSIIKDRPTVCLLDDHDYGHGNLWGEGGKASQGTKGATDGGFMYPASFVNMVERCQTFHLPDAFDPTPIKQGIGVYYTALNIGGVSFALLEDRKFKSAPLGNIPEMGPRPDHIKDPAYDRKSVDTPGLKPTRPAPARFPRALGHGLDRCTNESRPLPDRLLRSRAPPRQQEKPPAR